MTDYLDGALDKQTHVAFAAHAMICPLCHTLLNEVKEAVEACHVLAEPKAGVTRLEARILSMTMPETAMACTEFEESLTDYLDGFLSAALFHRWERHAALCEQCTDLPGEVVRSIAACYTYKSEELPVPAGLHQKILAATIGTEAPAIHREPASSRFREWVRSWNFPIAVPQFAPVAMMLMFAGLFLTQTVSADGSIAGMYQTGVELAEQTYKQSSDIFGVADADKQSNANKQPVEGTYVNEEKR